MVAKQNVVMVAKQNQLPSGPSSAGKPVGDRVTAASLGSAGKPTTAAASKPSTAAISAGKPGEDDINSSASIAGAESLTLSELRARLECKSSLPCVAEFLENLCIFEEWRRTKRPSHQARNAMLKVATQCGVPGKKEGQIRKAEDVAEDVEVRILSQGRPMLRDIAEMPAAAPSNPITAPTVSYTHLTLPTKRIV